MAFRYSKRIKVVPGLTLNLSRAGVGYSVGGRGARVTKRADGRITRTVGLPGTGLSHTAAVGGTTGRARTTRPASPPAPAPPKPKLFGPAWEKDLFKQLETNRSDGWAEVARSHHSEPGVPVLAASLDGLGHYTRVVAGDGDEHRARELLGWAAVKGGGELGQHSFVTKYLAARRWSVEIAGGVAAELSLAQDVVLLAAAELHQSAGNLDVAIWVVEQAEPTTAAGLSLAELYSDANRFADVIDLTDEITNEDDATALLLVLGPRLRSTGLPRCRPRGLEASHAITNATTGCPATRTVGTSADQPGNQPQSRGPQGPRNRAC